MSGVEQKQKSNTVAVIKVKDHAGRQFILLNGKKRGLFVSTVPGKKIERPYRVPFTSSFVLTVL